MVAKLVIIAAACISGIFGTQLGFISVCDDLTPVQILNEDRAVQEQAGQTVKKLTEFVEQDAELQETLNSTGFSGVILIPENQAILRNALVSNQQQLIEQLKMNVILGDAQEVVRPSLQGSNIIMSSSIVALQETGDTAQVTDILQFGSDCPGKESNKFEAWIISDFLLLPDTPQSIFTDEPQTYYVSTQQSPSPFLPYFSRTPYTPDNSTLTQTGNQFAQLTFTSEPPPPPPAVDYLLYGGNQDYSYSVYSSAFDPTNQFNVSVVDQELRGPFASMQPAQPPPPPQQDFGDICERGSPIELFEKSGEVRRLASKGAQFLQDAAQEALEIGDDSIYTYLNDVNFEGVILIPNNVAIENFEDSPYLNAEQLNNSYVAKIHVIPADLNVDTIGPIENSLHGTSVKLIRDEYVENEDDRRVIVETIVLVGQNCEQMEFWILRSQPLLPPLPISPSPTPPPPPPAPTPSTAVQISSPPPPLPVPTPLTGSASIFSSFVPLVFSPPQTEIESRQGRNLTTNLDQRGKLTTDGETVGIKPLTTDPIASDGFNFLLFQIDLNFQNLQVPQLEDLDLELDLEQDMVSVEDLKSV